MSVSKPFVFAVVCGLIGPDAARERLVVNSSGLPVNSQYAVERSADGRAIRWSTPGRSRPARRQDAVEDGWRFIHGGLSRFRWVAALARPRGLRVGVGDGLARSVRCAAVGKLRSGVLPIGRIGGGVRPTVLLAVSARDLAVMGRSPTAASTL